MGRLGTALVTIFDNSHTAKQITSASPAFRGRTPAQPSNRIVPAFHPKLTSGNAMDFVAVWKRVRSRCVDLGD